MQHHSTPETDGKPVLYQTGGFPKPSQGIKILIISLVFVTVLLLLLIALSILERDNPIFWPAAILFGLCICAFTALAVYGGRRYQEQKKPHLILCSDLLILYCKQPLTGKRYYHLALEEIEWFEARPALAVDAEWREHWELVGGPVTIMAAGKRFSAGVMDIKRTEQHLAALLPGKNVNFSIAQGC